MNEKQLRWFYLMVLALIWGSSFILMKKALLGLNPIMVGALRIVIAGIVLSLFGFKWIRTISKKDWNWLLLGSFVGTFFPVFLFVYAINNIDSSIASILNSLTPLNTLLIGVLFFGIPFIRKQFVGIMVGLLGAVLLILKGAQINTDQNYFFSIFIVLASVGYGTNVNIVKKKLSHVSATNITKANFLTLILPALVILWYSGFFDLEMNETTKASLIFVSILAIVCTALANLIFYKMVHISSPIFSSSVTYLIPLVAIFWGVLDGEKLELSQVFSGFLILLGVYLINSKQ